MSTTQVLDTDNSNYTGFPIGNIVLIVVMPLLLLFILRIAFCLQDKYCPYCCFSNKNTNQLQEKTIIV